ncbi:MAG: glycosyltransferase family 4 protein [Chloroflexota bacterium]
MKILHVVRQFYPSVGGVERFTLDLCRFTRQQGHECGVLTFNRDFASGRLLPARETVEGITVRRLPFFGPHRYRMAPTTLAHLGGYDLLHVHCIDSFVDYLAATRFIHRKPLVVSTHGGFFHSPWGTGLKRLYFRNVTRLALRAVDRVVCDSRQDLALFSTIAPEKCELIENAIDFESFAGVEKRVEPGLLLYVGRTDANKRIANLIQTLAAVAQRAPTARLALVGPDWLGEWPRLQALAAELGIEDRVLFVGQVSDDGLKDWLSRAQFFVSASVYEGFGIAAVEAMATGTVPILNDIEAFRHLTGDGVCGLLADFDEPGRAAETIVGALSLGNTECARLSQRARTAASEHAWQQAGRAFLSLYAEVVGNERSRQLPAG